MPRATISMGWKASGATLSAGWQLREEYGENGFRYTLQNTSGDIIIETRKYRTKLSSFFLCFRIDTNLVAKPGLYPYFLPKLDKIDS